MADMFKLSDMFKMAGKFKMGAATPERRGVELVKRAVGSSQLLTKHDSSNTTQVGPSTVYYSANASTNPWGILNPVNGSLNPWDILNNYNLIKIIFYNYVKSVFFYLSTTKYLNAHRDR